MNGERAIIEPAAVPQRRADENERHQRLRCRDKMIDARDDAREQSLLQQQIVDCVTGERQFRKAATATDFSCRDERSATAFCALAKGSAKWPRSVQAATRANPCR